MQKANSVDPDQTAPSGAVWSGSALFGYSILSDTLVYEILEYLPYSLEVSLWDVSNEYHNTVEPQWLEHLWDHGNSFETWVVRATEGNHGTSSGTK